MDKNELSPCPFCGGEAAAAHHPRNEQFGYVGLNVIQCRKCDAQVSANDPKDENGWATGSGMPEAIAAWNRRHQPPL